MRNCFLYLREIGLFLREIVKQIVTFFQKGKKTSSAPVESEDPSPSALSGSTSSVKDSGSKGKPAGILTGLFTNNPAALMKGRVSYD